MTTKTSPDATSSDYDAMLPYWEMVETILDGADAMKEAAQTYLPKFPNETTEDYEYRLENAKFTNVYADIVSNLAAKPFAEEVKLDDQAASRFKTLAEDIDGRGNNLHVFAASTFFDGLNNAVDWIMVEFTRAIPNPDGKPLSIAQEKAQGLRPYWVHVPAKRLLGVYADVVGGQEIIVHARIREDLTRRAGYDEVSVERVRVLNREPIVDVFDRIVGYAPATFEIWERQATERSGSSTWVNVDAGNITIGVIPLVPFITGRRKGGSWRFVPPLRDAAFLQVEHYQQETALKSIKELTAFPMLAGNGVQPSMKDGKPQMVPVGPRSVLYAPPNGGDSNSHGEWAFIEPSSESLRFLAEDVKNTEQQLRELGRQPLTAQTGITVVSAAFASQKASSAIQAWALGLKDALEQAFVLTAAWLNETTSPTVAVFTDFALDATDDKGPTVLTEARKNGDLSRETYWEELQRRNILSADFDPEEEMDRLDKELPDPDSAVDVAAAGTPPVDPETPPANDQQAA